MRSLRSNFILILAAITAAVMILMSAALAEEVFADSSVGFTVYYQDHKGNQLHDPGMFYGTVGEKPHVDYMEIDGYEPVVGKLTKTLSENEEENVFTFVYHVDKTDKADEPKLENVNVSEDAAGGSTETDTDNNNEGAGTKSEGSEEIDDDETPLAGAPTSGTDAGEDPDGEEPPAASDEKRSKERDLDKEKPLAEPGMPESQSEHIVMILIAVQIAILAVIFIFWKRMRNRARTA